MPFLSEPNETLSNAVQATTNVFNGGDSYEGTPDPYYLGMESGLISLIDDYILLLEVEDDSPIASLGIIVVTNANDSGDGSLRSAIAQANSTVGADTITFDSSLSGETITLTSNRLEISDSLTINGLGITIDAGGNGQVFLIDDGNPFNNVSVAISGVTISGAFDSGLFNAENLTLTDSTISGNSALTRGGGIHNQGILTLSNSTISGNSSDSVGGGIANYGDLTISNSTISGNSSNSVGGGIANAGSVTLTSSTISGNSSIFGGGLYNYGGFYYGYYGETTLINSIVANSFGGGDIFNLGSLYTYGNNLVEDGSNISGVLTGDPNLSPLQDNGGTTLTHLPLESSPVIDTGDNSEVEAEFDQRGSDRVVNGTVDLGAVEVQNRNSGGNELTVTNTNDSGDGSLRSAIAQANSTAGADTITFDSSLDGQTIVLSSGQLEIVDDLTIEGLGENALTIDANSNSRIFSIDDGDFENSIEVTIDQLTITGGNTDGSGGGIINRENLALSNSIITENSATNGGGGIRNDGGTVSISNSTISNNSSGNNGRGGGLYNSYGTLSISNSTISDNSASFGGGIRNDDTVNISNSTISGNSGSSGGGINNTSGTASISNSTISGNSGSSGGGIFNGYGILTLTNSIIANSVNGGDISGNGTVNTFGSNLVEDGSVEGVLTRDPNLSPLQDNGGTTLTHLPLEGSPVIDTGDNSEVEAEFDQRGSDRVVNGTVDLGAVEAQNTSPPAAEIRFLAGTGSGGSNEFSLVELQVDPVGEELIGPANFNPGLDVDPTTGLLYGTSSDLRIINPETGDVDNIGAIATNNESTLLIISIAFAPDGTLYGVANRDSDQDGETESQLYTINTQTGFATLVGEVPEFVWGIDFAPDGTLYGANFELFELDPETGNIIETIGNLENAIVLDIDFAADGFIYAVSNDSSDEIGRLYQIDPADASVTQLGSYESLTWGIASIGSGSNNNDTLNNAEFLSSSRFSSGFQAGIENEQGDNISSESLHTTVSGTGEGSFDYYRFFAQAGETLILDIDQNNFDTELFLFDESGTFLTSNDDLTEIGHIGDSNASFINFTVSVDGEYIVGVGKFDSSGEDGGITGDAPETGDSYELNISRLGSSNQAPIVDDASFSIDENTIAATIVGIVEATDPDGDSLTYSIVDGNLDVDGDEVPAFSISDTGELIVADSDDLNFESNSLFELEISVSNGELEDTATITINLNDLPENSPPTAQDDLNRTAQDTPLSVNLRTGVLANDSDPDDDFLTISAVQGDAANVGTEIALESGALLTLNADGSYEYNPNGAFENLNEGETATDSFTYTVSDDAGETDTATVTITIEPIVNNPPSVANPINDVTLERGELPSPISLFEVFEDSEDADQDLSFAIAANNNSDLIRAAIDNVTGELTLIVFSGTGSSDLTVQATDSDGLSVNETFTVTVNAVNTAPLVETPLDDLSVDSGSNPIIISLFDTFEDSQDADETLIFTVDNSNTALINASINSASGELFLQFPSTRTGSSEITLSAVDSSGLTTEETFLVTVNAVGEVIAFDENNDSLENASDTQLNANNPNLNLAGEIGDNEFTNQDVDLYQIILSEGDTLTADINTEESSNLDSVLRLFDSFGTEIIRNDDNQNDRDSFLEFTADSFQSYYLGVSGFGNAEYNPTNANSGNKGDTGSYNLALTLTATREEDPANDTISSAIDAASILAQEGEFRETGFIGDNQNLTETGFDVDLYQIQLNQGATAKIDVDTAGNTPFDPILRVFNATGGQLPNGFNNNASAPNEANNERDPYLEFTAPFSGSYYIGISDRANDLYSPFTTDNRVSGATGAYKIEIIQDITAAGDTPTETNPNDTLETATLIAISDRIQGTIGDRAEFITVPGLDVDLYNLSLETEQEISINLNSTSSLDPVLRLFDTEGNEIAINDDLGNSNNAFLQFTVPAAGEYYLGVSGFGNENYNVTEEGSGAPFASTGTYELLVSEPSLINPTLGAEEENDTLNTATATELTPDTLGSFKQSNAIGNNTNLDERGLDVDLFQVELDRNTRLTANINTANFDNSQLDSLLHIFNSEGESVAFNDDSPSFASPTEGRRVGDSFLEYVPSAAGIYYIGVSGVGNEAYNPNTAASGNSGSLGEYELEINLTPAIPEETPTNDTLDTATILELTNNRLTRNGFIGNHPDIEADVDFYEIEALQADDTLTITIENQSLNSDFASYVRIFNADGEELSLDYEAGDFPEPEIIVTIPEDSTYYIAVSAAANREYNPTVADSGISGTSGEYQITIERETPVRVQEGQEEIRPTANDDLNFNANSNQTAILNVLGNDTANDDQGFLEIVDFPETTEKGGTLELDNQSRFVYQPNPDFGGLDTFTYTIANESGGVDQGTVEINVNRPPEGSSAQVRLEIRAVPGKEDQLEDGLQIGDEFLVDVRFLDRVNPDNPSQALRSGYADLIFDPNVLQVISDESLDTDQILDGIIRYSQYPTGRKGTVRNEEGLVDEVGAFSAALTPPEEENRIFSLHFKAVGGGNTAVLASQAGQQTGSTITLFETFITDQRHQTSFGEINVAAAIAQTLDNENNFFAQTPVLNLANANNVINLQQEGIGGVKGIIEAMAIKVEFLDEAGNSLEEVSVGDEFQIVLSAEDLRSTGEQLGVFSAFVDLLYDTVLIDVTDARLSEPFVSPVAGLEEAINEGEGLVDELGGTNADFTPIRSGSQEFAVLTATAKAPGQLNVSTNAPEGATAKNTLFGVDVNLNEGTIYGDNTLTIGNATPEGNADLVITQFDAVIDHVLGGETTVNLTVQNQGAGTSPGFQVEIVYYRADNLEALAQEEPMVVKTLALGELAAGEQTPEIIEDVSLPVEVLLAEALEDDPSVFGQDIPAEGFESNNVDYLGVRLVNSQSSGEREQAFDNNIVTGEEGVNVDDIAYFPWDFVNNVGDGIVQGAADDLITDQEVTPVDVSFVFENIGEIISNQIIESQQTATAGLDLNRIDFDLDGAISPVDAVRVVNRVGYQLNPDVIENAP